MGFILHLVAGTRGVRLCRPQHTTVCVPNINALGDFGIAVSQQLIGDADPPFEMVRGRSNVAFRQRGVV